MDNRSAGVDDILLITLCGKVNADDDGLLPRSDIHRTKKMDPRVRMGEPCCNLNEAIEQPDTTIFQLGLNSEVRKRKDAPIKLETAVCVMPRQSCSSAF